jgi:hypothetical protein
MMMSVVEERFPFVKATVSEPVGASLLLTRGAGGECGSCSWKCDLVSSGTRDWASDPFSSFSGT